MTGERKGWRRGPPRRPPRAAAVPTEVQRQLARECLPPDPQVYSQRLNELLVAIEQNGAKMDKGCVDKHRLSMSGLKAQETMKWGADKARERYGELKQVDMKPKDQSNTTATRGR